MKPKFKLGDWVHCLRISSSIAMEFDFIGQVLSVAATDGMGDFEYSVSNAPLLPWSKKQRVLIWESEMARVVELVDTADLKSAATKRVGSNPASGTSIYRRKP